MGVRCGPPCRRCCSRDGSDSAGVSLCKTPAAVKVISNFYDPKCFLEVIETILLHHPANDTNFILCLLCCAFALNRYYSDSKLWRYLTSGFWRLMSNGPKRVSRIDSAHFLAAYYLGFSWEFLDANDTVLHILQRLLAIIMAITKMGFRKSTKPWYGYYLGMQQKLR